MKLEDLIQEALSEDIGEGDHTSLSTIDPKQTRSAQLMVKEDGVLSGLLIAELIFKTVDPKLDFSCDQQEGCLVKKGDIIFKVNGSTQSILKAERLVLNCMQRMSGIATTTRKYVDAVSGTNAKVMDTRKTTPGLRAWEKKAVKDGGASVS